MFMIICGINVILILINGVLIVIRWDNVIINVISKFIIVIICVFNWCFFIFSIFFKSCYIVLCSECENKIVNIMFFV